MSDINSGVVVVTKFCSSGSEAFQGYIDYINREEAQRNECLSKFNLYNDYMGDQDKTTGLFTNNKNILSEDEKETLKEVFETAQDNKSLMWQTVISFDNAWLEKHGLFDRDKFLVDEEKLKEISRKAVSKMYEGENLENVIWSGAIHYNTDNIHIHIAAVEPNPTRKSKQYIQYKEKEVNGKKVFELDEFGKKIPLLDKEGNIILKEEFSGKFKLQNIEACKSVVVNEIINQKDTNIQINQIIREQIVKQKKEMSLLQDDELKNSFLELYDSLPDVNRNLWNYNNNILSGLKSNIDSLADLYIKKYHGDSFKELESLLDEQEEKYKESYGKNNRSFKEEKLKDMYYRLGNAILKEIKEFDKNITQEDVEEIEKIRSEKEKIITEDDSYIDNSDDLYVSSEIEEVLKSGKFCCDWSDNYKLAKKYLYGSKDIKVNMKHGLELLNKEIEKGNVLAIYDMGDIYKFGREKKIDPIIADKYFKVALEGFNTLNGTKANSYFEYRIGKMYNLGNGVEQNYTEAASWFLMSSDKGNSFASYSLGGMYLYGKGVEKSNEKAFVYYNQAIEQSKRVNTYAEYEVGKMYQSGLGCEADDKKAQTHYSSALKGFLKTEEDMPNDNTQYRIGKMYQTGQGCEVNNEETIKWFELAATNKNSNANYELGKIFQKGIGCEIDNIKSYKHYSVALNAFLAVEKNYPNDNNQYRIGKMYQGGLGCEVANEKAMFWFERAAKKNNTYAQYELGKIYLSTKDETDIGKAIHWFKKSSMGNNKMADYALGKIYSSDMKSVRDLKEAEKWFLKSSRHGNSFADYSLGKIYNNKKETLYDPEKAVKFFIKAAQKENEFAQLSLGFAYLKGEGVEKSIPEAYSWFKKSSNNGNKYADEMLKEIENKLSTGKKIKFSFGRRAGREITQALNYLKKSLNKEHQQTIKNIIEHEEMVRREEEREF